MFLSSGLTRLDPGPAVVTEGEREDMRRGPMVGYAEDGESWIDTTNTLIRQNFGLHLAAVSDPLFGSDPIGLLNDNGIDTPLPFNQLIIVNFFNDYLFAGTLTVAELVAAAAFLNTDVLGVPSPYDDDRLRKTVGMMLGFAQFQEQ